MEVYIRSDGNALLLITGPFCTVGEVCLLILRVPTKPMPVIRTREVKQMRPHAVSPVTVTIEEINTTRYPGAVDSRSERPFESRVG